MRMPLRIYICVSAIEAFFCIPVIFSYIFAHSIILFLFSYIYFFFSERTRKIYLYKLVCPSRKDVDLNKQTKTIKILFNISGKLAAIMIQKCNINGETQEIAIAKTARLN